MDLSVKYHPKISHFRTYYKWLAAAKTNLGWFHTCVRATGERIIYGNEALSNIFSKADTQCHLHPI